MNIEISELLKNTSLALVILGVILLIIAAIGGIPIGNQTAPVMDTVWRYTLAISGGILLAIGIFLVLKEYSDQKKEKELSSETSSSGVEGNRGQGVSQVITYKNSGDFVSAFTARIRTAKRIDDVTWSSEEDGRERWSGQDRAAYHLLHEIITEIAKKDDVIWREVIIFSDKERFEREKKRILDPKTPGYNVGYYDIPPPTAPPRLGFAVIDNGDPDADTEVFLSSDKIRFSIKHPAIVAYFAQYFELAWKRAKKLKQGTKVYEDLLNELETLFDEDKIQPFQPVVRFNNDRELSEYILRRLGEARRNVCDLTIEDFSRNPGRRLHFLNTDDHKKYMNIVKELSERIEYREIIAFNEQESRISKAKWLIENAGKYYQLSGYVDLPDDTPPRHNFAIIDDEEVILKNLAIRQPEIVEYYSRYYEELWEQATPIKVSTVTNLGLIEQAEQKLQDQDTV
jgi:hypothetical protein